MPDTPERQIYLPAGEGIPPALDPTERTIQQLHNDIAASREIVTAIYDGKTSVITERINGMDEAVRILRISSDGIPQRMRDEVYHFREIAEVKFGAIDERFKESKDAVAAALQAQKESVNQQNISNSQAILKSEAQVKEQITILQSLINALQTGSTVQINDLKEAIGKLENRMQAMVGIREGGTETRRDISSGTSLIIAAIIGGGGLLIGVVTLLLKFHN